VSDRRLRLAVGVLAALGGGIAAYLLAVKLAGVAPACATGGCETVQRSRYSELVGIPLSAFGLVLYLTLLASALSIRETVRVAAAAVALAGAAVAVYLVYLQVAVIHAICQWCVASDAITVALAGVTVARAGILGRVPGEPRRPVDG
jgi:uncharacterized membrane protein